MTRFSCNLEENINMFDESLHLDRNYDILFRKIRIADKDVGFYFIDGFIDSNVMQRLMQSFYSLKADDIKDVFSFLRNGMPYVQSDVYTDVETAINKLLAGMTIIIIDDQPCCIGLDCRKYPARGVDEPWKDRVLKGSRDGFVEAVTQNIALIRRRIRDTSFCAEMLSVGTRSKTDVALCYIDDLVDKALLYKMRDKIQNIKVESLTMSIQSLAECLLDGKWINIMPKYKTTERPDTAASAILDGNIVVAVDNSPAVIILPTCIFDVMEEADDYYFPPVIGTYIRLSRLIITVFAVLITPWWMLCLNNPEQVPEWLRFVLITDDITVPVLLQLLLLEVAIDGLKLAAVNTPNVLSTPLSVIAGIIVGEFAVKSGWFNSESMLYMAFVSIATYSQANFEMGYALKFMRVLTLILTAAFNIWGFVIGIAISVSMVAFNKTISGKSFLFPIIPFSSEMLIRKMFRVRLPHRQKGEQK